jgi:hypothetical protein
MEISNLSFRDYLNDYWIVMFIILFSIYIIYNFTTYILIGLICIYINTHYSEKIQIYKNKLINYFNSIFTNYLGNCTFDPLPKTKT